MEDINWLALVVASILPLATGFLWYGPLFGKAWMQESGMTEEKAKKNESCKNVWFMCSFCFFNRI